MSTSMRRAWTFALIAALAPSAAASTWYVRADAAPAGNGTSWNTAFDSLQSAIAASTSGDEIWVAAGTYVPGNPGDARTVKFGLRPNVGVYGGFDGTETLLSQRDPRANVTILSGDLQGDDLPNFGNRADNAYHVVETLQANAAATLDGFTVRGGNANGMGQSQGWGGGIFCARATLRELIVEDNEAFAGAGIMLPEGASVAPIIRCTFRKNRSVAGGGGLLCTAQNLVLRECVFVGNRASGGGAIYLEFGSQGPGLIENCLIVGNAAATGTGGVRSAWSNLNIVNTTIAFNHSGTTQGGVSGGGQPSADITLSNSIVWGNTSDWQALTTYQAQLSPAVIVVSSAVEGSAGPLNVDPEFASPLGVDGLLGTPDDDFSLGCTSPYIDAGANALSAALTVDLAGNPRFADDPATPDTGSGTAPIVDLGAYEFVCACDQVTSYCPATLNSSGQPAVASATGTASVSANGLVLHVADGAALRNGRFFYGPQQVQVPFGDGWRCVGGSLFRLPIVLLDANGATSFPLNLTLPPAVTGPGAIQPGSTWNFQFTFRDPPGGPGGFNTSNALSVRFCP